MESVKDNMKLTLPPKFQTVTFGNRLSYTHEQAKVRWAEWS